MRESRRTRTVAVSSRHTSARPKDHDWNLAFGPTLVGVEVGVELDQSRPQAASLLRMLQSLIVDPGRPARTGTRLRSFLQDWVAPSVRAHAAMPR